MVQGCIILLQCCITLLQGCIILVLGFMIMRLYYNATRLYSIAAGLYHTGLYYITAGPRVYQEECVKQDVFFTEACFVVCDLFWFWFYYGIGLVPRINIHIRNLFSSAKMCT